MIITKSSLIPTCLNRSDTENGHNYQSTDVSHIMRVGDEINKGITVQEIKEKQVILPAGNGKVIMLHGPQNMFLNVR